MLPLRRKPTSTSRWGRAAIPALAVILVFALAGCGVLDEIQRQIELSANAPPAPRPKPRRAIPAPKPKPSIARAATTAKATDPQGSVEAARAPDAAPAFDPESLIGLQPAQTLAMLGDPAAVQERSPSMVWRYNRDDCALDLFFYMDLGANAFRVLAYEVRAAAPADGTAVGCPARLVSRANAR